MTGRYSSCMLLMSILFAALGGQAQSKLLYPLPLSHADLQVDASLQQLCAVSLGDGEAANSEVLKLTTTNFARGSKLNASWEAEGPCGGEWQLDLFDANGLHVHKWNARAATTKACGHPSLYWMDVDLPKAVCKYCTFRVMRTRVEGEGPTRKLLDQPEVVGCGKVAISGSKKGHADVTPKSLGQKVAEVTGLSWLDRNTGGLLSRSSRSLLQSYDYNQPATSNTASPSPSSASASPSSGGYASGPSKCTPSTLPGFVCQHKAVSKHFGGPMNDNGTDVWVHWEVRDSENRVCFAAETTAKGWVGLGWSKSNPPEMIGSTAVIGWIAEGNRSTTAIYNLDAKNVRHILPSRSEGPQSGFHTFQAEQPAVYYNTTTGNLILSYCRPYDSYMQRGYGKQYMITAYSIDWRGLQRHTWRTPLLIDLSASTAQSVEPRLTQKYVTAHAWCMFVAWGVLLPAGIIYARYFKDTSGKWYLFHMAVQITALLLLLSAFILAVAKNRPLPGDLPHYQLGVAAVILALLQPFTSVPRLMMHHGHIMKSVLWAYLHWTVGRAAVVFAWVNMFMGMGRYRTMFGLGSWPERAFGCYIGGIILICVVLENRRVRKIEFRQRKREEDLRNRIAEMDKTGGGGGRQVAPGAVDLEDEFLIEQAIAAKGGDPGFSAKVSRDQDKFDSELLELEMLGRNHKNSA